MRLTIDQWLEDGRSLLAAGIERHEAAAQKLRDLLAAVEAVHSNAPSPNRKAAPAPAPRPAQPTARPAPVSTRDREAKVIHCILNAGRPIAPHEIREQTGLSKFQLTPVLRQLADEGRVNAEGTTNGRRYSLTERAPHSEHRARVDASHAREAKRTDGKIDLVVLRDKCMRAILADPDTLTEDNLAQALGRSRDDIADAVGDLLLNDRVTLNPDGTYRRNGQPASPEIAA